MKSVLTLAAAAAIASLIASGDAQAAPAATQSPLPGIAAQDLLQPVQWRRCRAARRICAARWGWGGWRFRRCVRTHAC